MTKDGITEEKREALRQRAVNVLLEMRALYLQGGGNALKHWQQIQDRLRMTTRTCSTVTEWATAMCTSLKLSAPSSSLSSAIGELVDEASCVHDPDFLDLIEREYAYLMALTRSEADDRRTQRESSREAEV